jgi:hypothetical protein
MYKNHFTNPTKTQQNSSKSHTIHHHKKAWHTWKKPRLRILEVFMLFASKKSSKNCNDENLRHRKVSDLLRMWEERIHKQASNRSIALGWWKNRAVSSKGSVDIMS